MDVQAKKILDTVWCETAPQSRMDPEEYGIDRATGWGIDYEQNKFPERMVWNQLLRELQGALREKMREGVLTWQDDLDYPQYAFVKYQGRLYYSTEAVKSGGDNPIASVAWREY